MSAEDSPSQDRSNELAQLFELSLDLLCVAGIDGYFKRINPAFEALLGYSREELLSRSFLEFVHPDDREATLAEMQRLADGQAVVDFTNRYRLKGGGYRWLAWRATPRPEAGLVYAVARDITEQRRLTELLRRQAAELARSNADLEQFASIASHDLRAPLRGLSSLLDWIEDDLDAEEIQKVRQHLSRLRSQIDRMRSLIEDVLSYATAGQQAADLTAVDCNAMLEELVTLIAPPAGFEVKWDSLPTFETERTPLEQVFRNLIANAVQHHHQDKGTIEISAIDAGTFFEFRVADDGPGIRESRRTKIFDMFEKSPSGDAKNSTGIGLALVQRLVEQQGGRIRVVATPGGGSTFVFTWPKETGRQELEVG